MEVVLQSCCLTLLLFRIHKLVGIYLLIHFLSISKLAVCFVGHDPTFFSFVLA